MKFLHRIDRVIGFESDNQIAAKFARERVRSVRDFIHLYYLSILAPFLATAMLHFDEPVTIVTGLVLLAAVILRFRHWASPVPEGKSEDVNAVAARVTGAMVVLLSCMQAVFYTKLAISDFHTGPNSLGWAQDLFVGMLAAIVQASALTGIIFASRVILFCFLLPQVCVLCILFGYENAIGSVAIFAIAGIIYYLAEASHKIQLRLFKAQYDADLALVQVGNTNEKLAHTQREAWLKSETDSLTGLRNRAAFIRDVELQIEEGRSGILTMIDLDRFKPINDLYGHHLGDLVLMNVARRLRSTVPMEAVVGRLGGDEFGIFFPYSEAIARTEDIIAQCSVALQNLRKPMWLSGSLITVGGSAGARILSRANKDVGAALRDAGAALYVAKRDSLSEIKIFDAELSKERKWLHAIETELTESTHIEHLSLVYQPILDLKSGELVSLEALARWKHPVLGNISPATFIPAAERLGSIKSITITLLNKALEFASTWGDRGCRLSFNLSAAHICSEGAADELVALVQSKGFPPHRLQFEITETAMLVNFAAARQNVAILRNAGCHIALDDFGAGFASLHYLREITFDRVKIDGSLIHGAREAQGRAVLNGIIRMLEAMNLESVAEYISSESDQITAFELGAKFGQGYHLGAPLDERAVLKLLAKNPLRQRSRGRSDYFNQTLQGGPKSAGKTVRTLRCVS